MFNRPFRHSYPIHLYIYPCLFFVGGVALTTWTDNFAYLGLLGLLGAVSAAHIIIADIIQERAQYVDSETRRLEAIQHLDMEARYQLGMAKLPTEMTIRIDKTEAEGNDFSQSWGRPPIEPWKMKVIAQACLNGRPFSIREWTPVKAGRLLSDPEYRNLEAWLLHPIQDRPDIQFIVAKNVADNRQGFEWTELGRQMLQKCVDDPLYGAKT